MYLLVITNKDRIEDSKKKGEGEDINGSETPRAYKKRYRHVQGKDGTNAWHRRNRAALYTMGQCETHQGRSRSCHRGRGGENKQERSQCSYTIPEE